MEPPEILVEDENFCKVVPCPFFVKELQVFQVIQSEVRSVAAAG